MRIIQGYNWHCLASFCDFHSISFRTMRQLVRLASSKVFTVYLLYSSTISGCLPACIADLARTAAAT